MQGSMGYMARDQESRRDVAAWYPEAKSVLLCGFGYPSGRTSPAAAGHGRLARYATLEDYHPELKARLGRVLDWLSAESPGADGRVFVDSSPLLERLYARYAGLGWVGKSTMLVSRHAGTYFLLAGVALNLELPADEPEVDRCGSCRRCLDACPTQAFPRERVLDASRCVSYFTIEHRRNIPEEFREKIGNWVFGCDVCQEVCPWNRFAPGRSVLKPLLEPAQDLEDLAALDGPAFRRRFGPTPVERARRRGLARNALLAMGNARDPRHRPTLERFAGDTDPVLSEQALWSLARLPPDGES